MSMALGRADWPIHLAVPINNQRRALRLKQLGHLSQIIVPDLVQNVDRENPIRSAPDGINLVGEHRLDAFEFASSRLGFHQLKHPRLFVQRNHFQIGTAPGQFDRERSSAGAEINDDSPAGRVEECRDIVWREELESFGIVEQRSPRGIEHLGLFGAFP